MYVTLILGNPAVKRGLYAVAKHAEATALRLKLLMGGTDRMSALWESFDVDWALCTVVIVDVR